MHSFECPPRAIHYCKFDCIHVHFQTPVFTHGQFYIAMSRCTSGNHIKILFPEDSTSNVTKDIVFSEALLKDTL